MVDGDALGIFLDGGNKFSPEHEQQNAIAFGPAQSEHPRVGSVWNDDRHHSRIGMMPGNGKIRILILVACEPNRKGADQEKENIEEALKQTA